MTIEEKRARFAVLILLFIPVCLFSESIRGTVTENISVGSDIDREIGIELVLDEFAAIHLGEDSRFLKGVLIEIVLSDLLLRYTESFGITLYYAVQPNPELGMKSFTGERGLFALLPHTNRSYLRIPVKSDSRDAETREDNQEPVNTTSDPITLDSFPLLLGLQPISKGIPEDVMNRKVFFTVRPEIEQKGVLILSLHRPEGFEEDEVSLMLDEEEIGEEVFPLVLSAGTHELNILSEMFRTKTAAIMINPGKTTALEVELEPNVALLTLESLPGASVFLDGEKVVQIGNKRIQLTEGVHTVRFKIGEYSTSKRFNAERGKSYKISLIFDIQVKED